MEKFEWLSGQQAISHWVKDTGFTSAFCKNCGGPVPNELRKMQCYWIPVGGLEDAEHVTIIGHICVSSKAVWGVIDAQVPAYTELPAKEELLKFLN